MPTPHLIVMLTHNDHTVANASEIYLQNRHSQARFWGFKEEPLSRQEMKDLFTLMKQDGKTTFLEVVEYTEDAGLAGAEAALECGCDILMGTKFYPSINQFCQANRLKYMPFVGVHGIDVLGYRYTGDATKLNAELVKSVSVPVCIAGSVNSYHRLDELKAARPWAFTIGSAFFDNQFSGSIAEQIDKVCDYMKA